MAVKVLYFDREGKQISKEEREKLFEDRNYRVFKEFDNDGVYIALNWVGIVRNPQNIFPDHYPIFVMNVLNYTSDGKLVPDPISDGVSFYRENVALEAYQNLIRRYAPENYKEDAKGGFVEVDNNLAPPDPNIPLTESGDDIGAW